MKLQLGSQCVVSSRMWEHKAGEGRGQKEITQECVLCPVHEDRLMKGLKGRCDMVAFVFQKGHWLSCGRNETSSRETGGEG